MKKSFAAQLALALALMLSAATLGTFAQTLDSQARPNRNLPRRKAFPNDQPNVRQRQGLKNLPPAAPGQKQRLQQQLIQRLGLSDEQRLRMADIRQNNEENIIIAGRRLRQARAQLDRAIMNENFDEKFIEARIEELVAAQAEVTRLQTRIRAQLRSVLTPEQVTRLKTLEREMRERLREQRELGPRGQNFNEPNPPPIPDLLSLLLFEDE